jgi:hypothetical protein
VGVKTALDHYQVRGWTGWHRFVTLAMLALALLVILTTDTTTDACTGEDRELIAMTVAETRRLLNAFVLATPLPAAHTLHWSNWRRKVQATARRAHYQHRLAHDRTG